MNYFDENDFGNLKFFIDNFSTSLAKKKAYNNNYVNPSVCYNLKSREGRLVLGNGLEEITIPISTLHSSPSTFVTRNPIPSNVKKIFKYRCFSHDNQTFLYFLVVICQDKKVYYTPLFFLNDDYYCINHTFNEYPIGINFRISGDDVMGFSSKSDNLLVWFCDEDPITVDTAPSFKSVCFHNDRLFAIDTKWDYIVRYSANCNPLDWLKNTTESEDAGMLELNDYKGELKNLISFLDNVYVFRDFGISKINTYLKSDFTTSNIYDAGQKIYCDSVCICGEKIYFLQQDGLYSFDGYDVKKVDSSICEKLAEYDQEQANTCYHDNKLYIACKIGFNDEVLSSNNALVEFDLATQEYNILYGVDIVSMVSVNYLFYKRLVIALNNSNKLWVLNDTGKVGSSVLDKKFESPNLLFDNFTQKNILKDIEVICNKEFDLTIHFDDKVRTYKIPESSNLRKIRVNISGTIFRYDITSSLEDFDITLLQFNFKQPK